MGKVKVRQLIAPDGTTTFEVFGATGKKCLDYTREAEAALGGAVSREMKPEGGGVTLPVRQAVKGGA